MDPELARKNLRLAWMLFGAIAVAAVARYGRWLAIGLMALSLPVAVYHQVVWRSFVVANLGVPSNLIDTIRSTVPRGMW